MSLNNKAAESKYNVSIPITTSLGVLASGESENTPCHIETQLRIEVTGVGPTNEIQIYGRIRSSSLWHYIATVTGPVTGTADISTYDFIRYFHTISDGVGNLAASGFIFNFSSGGSGGDASSANQIVGNNYLSNISKENTSYSMRIDNTVTNVMYIGEAAIGSSDSASVWRIKIIDSTTTVTIIKYASTGIFDQVWNNRTSLTYL